MLLNLITLVALVALVIYIVRAATGLKATADALREELRKFKEGGVDELVGQKLDVLRKRAEEELQNRERFIQQNRTELLEQQRKATEATAQFNKDLGTVTTRIETLSELQTKVGELNDLLKPQQLRGELGEVIVRELIADKFPQGKYEEDHVFADGKKVEFAIHLNGRLIPIDSKLQLEDYKRMREADDRQRQTLRTEFKRKIKQKIDEVQTYIRPEEGTYNFALMVIPSEAVYYDVVANKDFTEPDGLYAYARAQKVFIVSPLTFWAYLTAVAQGLQGMEIGRRAEEILAGLQTLATRIRQFSGDEFRLLGSHLRNASTQYDEAQRKLREIEDEVVRWERVETSPLHQEGAAR